MLLRAGLEIDALDAMILKTDPRGRGAGHGGEAPSPSPGGQRLLSQDPPVRSVANEHAAVDSRRHEAAALVQKRDAEHAPGVPGEALARGQRRRPPSAVRRKCQHRRGRLKRRPLADQLPRRDRPQVDHAVARRDRHPAGIGIDRQRRDR